ARLDEGFDQLQTARLAIGFALPLLIGNGNVMLGLPRRRDTQVKGSAQRHGHGNVSFSNLDSAHTGGPLAALRRRSVTGARAQPARAPWACSSPPKDRCVAAR